MNSKKAKGLRRAVRIAASIDVLHKADLIDTFNRVTSADYLKSRTYFPKEYIAYKNLKKCYKKAVKENSKIAKDITILVNNLGDSSKFHLKTQEDKEYVVENSLMIFSKIREYLFPYAEKQAMRGSNGNKLGRTHKKNRNANFRL